MNLSTIDVSILNDMRRWIVYVYFGVATLGLLGHVLNLLVFTQLRIFRENRWVLYLSIESVVDIIYDAVQLISYILQSVYSVDPQSSVLVWCRLRSILLQTCTLISAFTVCFAACDQFLCTSYRLNLRQMCSFKLVRYLIFIGGFIWFLHSVIFSLYLYIGTPSGCVIIDPHFAAYSSGFFYPVLYGPLPIVIAAVSSLLAFHNVRHIVRRQVPIVRRRLDQQMTAMILIRALFYVIFSSPYAIYRAIVVARPIPQSDLFQQALRQLLQVAFTCWAWTNFTVRTCLVCLITTCLPFRLVSICFWPCLRSSVAK